VGSLHATAELNYTDESQKSAITGTA